MVVFGTSQKLKFESKKWLLNDYAVVTQGLLSVYKTNTPACETASFLAVTA